VYFEGDGQGLPLTGARLVLHVTSNFVDSISYRSFLDLASRVAAGRGGITFTFDRSPSEDVTLSAFTKRYGMDPGLLKRAGESWQWRSALFSSVAINLPRIAKRSDNDQARVFESVREALELVAQASLEKRVFIEKLLSRGESGVLALLAVRPNNEPLLRLSWTAHAICPVGLSEIAEQIIGEPLEKSKETQAFAERLIQHLHEEVERLSEKHKVRFILAESHDRTAALRLAKLDGAESRYSNAAKISSEKSLTALERLRIEGDWQHGAIFGAFTELMDSEIELSAEQMAVLISRAFFQTGNAALTVAVSYTICVQCRDVTKGIQSACAKCGSTKVDVLAQRDGYFSRM
jgi:ribonucleoside-triphosphate reductase (formate)